MPAVSAGSRFVRLASRLVAACLVSCDAAAHAEEPAPASVPSPFIRAFSVRLAHLPPDGTYAMGIALDVRRDRKSVFLSGDVLRLRDPRPGSEDPGMFLLVGAIGRWIAGGTSVSIRAEAVGTLFAMVIGDVGVGAPGVGGGLVVEWRVARALALTGGTRVTVPFPLADSSAALCVALGPLALSAGWRDFRFLPVFGLPGRYSSGPEVLASMLF